MTELAHPRMTTATRISQRLAASLQRLWEEPTAAECRRLSREAEPNPLAAQLDDREDGTNVPRDPAAVR